MRKTILVAFALYAVTILNPSFVKAEDAVNITAIDIKGNKSISSNTIISKMKLRVGAPYQESVVSDDLKRLYLLGYFSDIKIDKEDYKGGVKILVTVEERPIIEKILFSGIKRLRKTSDKLKEELKSKETQYLDYPSLNEDAVSVKKSYEKIGYGNAKVEYDVSLDKEKNKAKVEFKITEGQRLKIKKIIISGNKSFSNRRLLKLMKTKRAWLFNGGSIKEEVFKEDIERLNAFYKKNGFSDVELAYEIKENVRRPYLLAIEITIKEGMKYLAGNIEIKGNENIDKTQILLKLKECVPGKVFSQEALKEDISNIQSLYFDKGYIFAQVEEVASLNPATNRVDITYNITENEIAYVNRIKIRGNVKTKDIVVRRELRIKPGDRFDGEKLRRSKERLQNLGYFEEVSYDVEDAQVQDPNKKDLLVDVKESKTGAFSFGGGYSSVDQFVGFMEIEQKNFDWKNFPYFTGAGQDLKLRASFGTLSDSYDLSFTEPWIFDYPVSFGFDAYKRTHDRESDVGYGYDENVTGGDLRLGKELSEYLKGNLTYRMDTIEIGSVTDSSTTDLKSEEGTNTISSLTTGLNYDSRDNVFNPTKGNVLGGSFEIAGGPFGGDKDFLKLYSNMSHYLSLFKGSVIEIRGRAGLADPYGDSDTMPIYERFFAGGANTIRGYHERKIGPIDLVSEDPLGGESLLIGNLEYTYPLIEFLKVALFYDTGNVWAKMSDIGSGGFKSGAGFGVRIKTPLGPVVLDYGIPLNKEPGEETKGNGRLHFSMSHGF